MIKIMVKHNLL